ncbi:MAG: hypothetical protein K2L17_04970 [Muribaculaceae bacterium]|nr:hypothetical protein [Muribaculaceae bacterium]
MLESLVSDILPEDLILPDGTRIPKEEIDWSLAYTNYKYTTDDNNKQVDSAGDMSKSVRDILDKESELD